MQRLVSRPPLTDRPPDKIPWGDDEFSRRMLREHLDQAHDRASRRTSTIDAHVTWIFRELLGGASGRVLDLGCGPGLYTERLAALGCTCVGVDISPASIAHAEAIAGERDLDCTYVLGDVRRVGLGADHDVAMMLFGEFNTFTREDAAAILRRAAVSVRPGGVVLLEAHRFAAVEAEGRSGTSWYTSASGLFADRPHLTLLEHAWNETTATASARFFVVDDRGDVAEYGEALHAYTDADYDDAMRSAGLEDVAVVAADGPFADPTMVVVTGRRGP